MLNKKRFLVDGDDDEDDNRFILNLSCEQFEKIKIITIQLYIIIKYNRILVKANFSLWTLAKTWGVVSVMEWATNNEYLPKNVYCLLNKEFRIQRRLIVEILLLEDSRTVTGNVRRRNMIKYEQLDISGSVQVFSRVVQVKHDAYLLIIL